MSPRPTGWYRWDGESLVLDVRVQPRASRDEVVGVQNDRLRIRITAPPTEGLANKHLLRYVAELCGVAPSRVSLVSGGNGREKRLRIDAPRRLPPYVRGRENGRGESESGTSA